MDAEKLKDYFQNDRFAVSNGIKLVDVGIGYCKAMLEIEERHLNAANVIQGGAVFTLADFAFGCAANTRGQLALAVNANISFLKGKSDGTLFATATEVCDPNRIAAYDVLITDEEEAVIARFNGIAYRKNQVHPF
jgi:acyl-CoA thioesterase